MVVINNELFCSFDLKIVKIGSSTEFKKLSNLLLFHEEVIHFYKHLFSEVVTPAFGQHTWWRGIVTPSTVSYKFTFTYIDTGFQM